MADVSKHDWKLYSERLPKWQEAWMSKLNREYIEILSRDGSSAEKFWALEKRIAKDKRHPGVIVERKRSNMHQIIATMLYDGTISEPDLEGFSEDTIETVLHCQKIWSIHNKAVKDKTDADEGSKN